MAISPVINPSRPALNYPPIKQTQTMTTRTNPIYTDIARKKRSKHAQMHGISSHNDTFISRNLIWNEQLTG